jgi:hypothetical protein
MEEIVVSEFSTFYYAKVVGAIMVSAIICLIFIFNSITNQETGSQLISTVIFCLASLSVGYYYLFKNCFKLTITDESIFIKYYIRNKELEVLYDDIIRVSTYRQSSNSSGYGTNYQYFAIELKNGKSISISEGDYNNYEHIKATIYKHK